MHILYLTTCVEDPFSGGSEETFLFIYPGNGILGIKLALKGACLHQQAREYRL